jgi:Icc-related predicted phosphoesterase
MRIAATADIHFSPESFGRISDSLSHVRDEADVLIIAGDLTNFGKPEEMRSLLIALTRLRTTIVAVLGNHDYESGKEQELMRMMAAEGIMVLDGNSYERDGVGFAGAKGFIGGFGRSVLTAFGEKEIKALVQTSIDETMKLEQALSSLHTRKIVAVTHYAPVVDTLEGELHEIWPYLGTSRLAEVIDRYGAALALHGHAHRGSPDGKTPAGIPVHNVALTLHRNQALSRPYRLFDV